MASEIELKPCPCCGGHATMEHGAERSENGWVVCMECGLSTRYHDDPAEAAAEWNRRACDAHHETPSTVHNGDCVPQTKRNAAATSEKPEVADAVIAEMRERAKFLRDGRELDIHNSVVVLGCYLDETLADLADRLEAALKRERAAFDCECAGIAELAAKEEAARHKPAWQALARIGDAIQQKMGTSPCSVTEHECAIMNLCMRTFAEQSHRQQLLNEDKVREALMNLTNAALKVLVTRGHEGEDLRTLGYYTDRANHALAAQEGGMGDGV